VSTRDIYALADDPEAIANSGGLLSEFDFVRGSTDELRDLCLSRLAQCIGERPGVIRLLWTLVGEHDTSFRIVASGELFLAGNVCGCRERPVVHTTRFIQELVQREERAASVIARHFLDSDLASVLSALSQLDRRGLMAVLRPLSVYQMKQRLAKLRGHKAEQMVAQTLDRLNIPFDPRAKLETLGARDVRVPYIEGREVNIAIPRVEGARVLIQCCYYQSMTGSIANKTVRESKETQSAVDRYNRGKTRSERVALWLFVDGGGWLGMVGILRNLLAIPDEFVQLNTLERKLRRLK